jgi:hypothetical protein
MANELLDALRHDIDDLQDQLNDTLTAIENEAKQQSHWGKFLKVVTIVLDALAATREGAAKIFPNSDNWITWQLKFDLVRKQYLPFLVPDDQSPALTFCISRLAP